MQPLSCYRSSSHCSHACRVKSSVPIEIVFRTFVYPDGMNSGGVGSLISGMQWLKLIQSFRCRAGHGKSSCRPLVYLVAAAAVEVQPGELLLASQMQQPAALVALEHTGTLDPRSCPGLGVELCTYVVYIAADLLVLQIRVLS